MAPQSVCLRHRLYGAGRVPLLTAEEKLQLGAMVREWRNWLARADQAPAGVRRRGLRPPQGYKIARTTAHHVNWVEVTDTDVMNDRQLICHSRPHTAGQCRAAMGEPEAAGLEASRLSGDLSRLADVRFSQLFFG